MRRRSAMARRKRKTEVKSKGTLPERIPLERLDRKPPKGKCWKVTMTLVWNPAYVPMVEKMQEDGNTVREHAVTRHTTKPAYAKTAELAAKRVKKAWKKLFAERVLRFTRIRVVKYNDFWEEPFEVRHARKLARISRIKNNRAKRVRKS
jgi:hypothetical protein